MRTTRSSAKRKCCGRARNRVLTPYYASVCNCAIASQFHSSLTCTEDSTPLSSNDLLKISVAKDSIRKYYRISEMKGDASQLSLRQINLVRMSIDRFNNLDFSSCEDVFLWTHIIPMRASRQESSLTDEEIPLSVKVSYSKLREYRRTNREG